MVPFEGAIPPQYLGRGMHFQMQFLWGGVELGLALKMFYEGLHFPKHFDVVWYCLCCFLLL